MSRALTSGKLDSRQDRPRALPKAHEPILFRSADPTNSYDIPVLEEHPRLASTELDGLLPTHVLLQHAAPGMFVRAADGPAAEQIADAQVASSNGVVGDHFRERPDEVAAAGFGDPRGVACAGCTGKVGG